MKVLVVLAHPSPESLCGSIAREAEKALKKNGHLAVAVDLYREGFDPILPAEEIAKGSAPRADAAEHCRLVSEADGVIVVHPNWWGQPPAVLKGWLDRVLRQGVAYAFGPQGQIRGLLKARAGLVFNTSNTPAEAEARLYGDPLQALWEKCVFGFCGVPVFYRRNFTSVIMSTPDERRAWLAEVREAVGKYFPADHE